MIKVISFDIGGTLIKNEGNNKNDINSLAMLVNKPYELVRTAYKEIFQKKKGTLLELVEMFCSYLNIQINNDIIKFFSDKFTISENDTISANTIKLIKKLKNQGYKIILFSNSCCLLKSNLDIENIDYIFYSYELGYTKSEEESYRIIEKKLNNKPYEFLHIGDNLKSDYIFPRKYGWNALYYTSNISKDYDSISNLSDVCKILKNIEY